MLVSVRCSDALNAAIPEFLLATRPTLAHITLYNFYNCFFDDVSEFNFDR